MPGMLCINKWGHISLSSVSVLSDYHLCFLFAVFQTPAQILPQIWSDQPGLPDSGTDPPTDPVRSSFHPCRDGSYSGHSLLPPLVDGRHSRHWKPAFLCCAARLVIAPPHAQVWGLLLLPVQRTRCVWFTPIVIYNQVPTISQKCVTLTQLFLAPHL